MSRELDSDGPFSARRADRAEQRAPQWPLLARLPRVGTTQVPPRAPAPPLASQTPAYDEEPLKIVDTFAEVGSRRRYVIDPPHATATPLPEPAERVMSQREPATLQAPASRLTRHYRIDGAAGHRPPGRMIAREREIATISGSIFRLHAALAPYMGLAAAIALVLGGSFLYWRAFSRAGGAIPTAHSLEFNNGLSREAAAPADATPVPVSASALQAPSIEWTPPPRVAAVTAPSLNEVEAPAVVPPGPQPSATDGPSLTPAEAPAANEPITTTNIDATITPTPQGEDYPITPFPAFSFVATTPVAEVSPAADLAERPPLPTVVPTATR